MKGDSYINLYGETISLDGLDAEERVLVNRLRRRAGTNPDWCDFSNSAMRAVVEFYDGRGVRRKQAREGPVMEIALDLSSRLGVAQGYIAAATFYYRDKLARLVLRLPSRRGCSQETRYPEE